MTASQATALVYLTADAALSGPLARLEARACGEPGPFPSWARRASWLAEKEAVTGAVLAVVVRRIRRGDAAVVPVVVLLGGVAVRAVFADAVRRPRPPKAWWRAEPHGWSFPSRHTTHAVLTAGMLLDEIDPSPGAAPGVMAGVGFVAVVGASRVRLGVHWPTDVLGGVLTAILWRRLVLPRLGDLRRRGALPAPVLAAVASEAVQ